MRRPARAAAAGVAALLALVPAACSGADGRTLRVYAAASLAAPFEQLVAQFEADRSDVDVELVLSGSADLVAQVLEGAPADVLASADTTTMGALVDAGLVDRGPEPFASNSLQIVVPPGNPAEVGTLADLADEDVRLVVCAPEVPCGAAAARVAAVAGVALRPASEEQSVTDVLAKVTSGEADAGLVYVTDAIAAGNRVEALSFRESPTAVNTYPVATLADSDEPGLAGEFVDLVVGPEGREVLRDAGFARP